MDNLYLETFFCEDHNATSYSTETFFQLAVKALQVMREDHNATSYSTET